MLIRLALLLSFILAFFSSSASALEDENLLVALPKGYKVGFQKKTDRGIISEFVPAGETVEGWTEMVTVQVFLNMRNVTPVQFRDGLEKRWSIACPDSQFSKVGESVQNGYPTLMWLQACKLNKQSGKPEYTWIKAIQGRDSFYILQKAFKFAPNDAQTKEWISYLDKISVCDTRLPERPCKM